MIIISERNNNILQIEDTYSSIEHNGVYFVFEFFYLGGVHR